MRFPVLDEAFVACSVGYDGMWYTEVTWASSGQSVLMVHLVVTFKVTFVELRVTSERSHDASLER